VTCFVGCTSVDIWRYIRVCLSFATDKDVYCVGMMEITTARMVYVLRGFACVLVRLFYINCAILPLKIP
jgi:hypothetical protein